MDLASLFAEGVKTAVPTNARTFIGSLLGREQPITARDFTSSEIEALRALAQAAPPNGQVTYSTYDRAFPPGHPLMEPRGLNLLGALDLRRDSSPVDVVRTTLGQFKVQPAPEGYMVSDTYNFNPQYPTREASQSALWALMFGGEGARPLTGNSTYDKLRLAGEAFGPRGGGSDTSGVPVSAYIPKY